jgi:hypothetical protein
VHVLGPHGAGDAAASAAAASPFAAAAGGQASMVSRTGSSTGLPGLRKLQRSASNASDATTVSDVSEHSDQFHSEAGSGVYSDDTSANGEAMAGGVPPIVYRTCPCGCRACILRKGFSSDPLPPV